MKKLFTITALVLTLALPGFSQTFGVKGGLNLSNMVFVGDFGSLKEKVNPGFHIGATVDVPIFEMLSFETGLLLNTKGYRMKRTEENNIGTWEIKETVNLMYLDIPLTARGSYDFGAIKAYGIFGPYIGFGLTGKAKSKSTFLGETERDSETVNWGSDEDDDLKRLDYGLIFGAGVEYQSFVLGFQYGLGLADITPEQNSFIDIDIKWKHRVFGIMAGYRFGGN